MRHLSGRFQQQQALVGCCQKQPPAARLFTTMFEVFRRLEAEQRQLKPVLAAAGLGVADPRIAAGLGQHRHDIVDEAHGPLGGIRTEGPAARQKTTTSTRSNPRSNNGRRELLPGNGIGQSR